MPTLHLIDADSIQACPAVLRAVRRAIESSQNREDRLLLLGGQPLGEDARRAGLDSGDRIAVPFGKAWLGQRRIKHWLRAQRGFDLAACWSINTLHAAKFTLPETPKLLTLVHTPAYSGLKRLKHMVQNHHDRPVRVCAATGALCERLDGLGIRAQVDPTLTDIGPPPPAPPPLRTDLRHDWGVSGPNHWVVGVLSDHPSQADALDAVTLTCLAGVSLSACLGRPQTITLVMHPGQRHRGRAQRFLTDQPVGPRIVQDTRMNQPWRVLPGCDVALALGRDAGGLSLFWALGQGLPVIASARGPAGELGNRPANAQVHLANSDAPKDLAHVLHGVLTDVTKFPG